MSEINNAIGTVSMNVLVQAIITIMLTATVIMLTVTNRDIPSTIMTAWLVTLGVWIPQPSPKNTTP